MEHNAEVIGFGALNCDRICRVDDLALPGREIGVVSAVRQPGGSAANTIVGLARLGVKTGFLGTVAMTEKEHSYWTICGVKALMCTASRYQREILAQR